MERISIIVPVYNSEKTIDKCIKSIINQSYNNFRLILVNDGSIDNSSKICRSYEKMDKRVLVIDSKNIGCVHAIMLGVKSANTEYITFVDSDDWLRKDCIEIIMEELEKTSCDILAFKSYKVAGKIGFIKKEMDGTYFKEDKLYEGENIRKKLVSAYLQGHPFPTSVFSKVYRREMLLDSGKYLKVINFFGEDLYLNLELFLKAEKVKIICDSLYYYRINGETNQYMPYMFNDIVNGYKIQKEVIEEFYKDSAKDSYRGISIMLLNCFRICLENLYFSTMSEDEIIDKIKIFLMEDSIRKAALNEGAQKYFNREFIMAVENRDYNYMFNESKDRFEKKRIKRGLKKIASYI